MSNRLLPFALMLITACTLTACRERQSPQRSAVVTATTAPTTRPTEHVDFPEADRLIDEAIVQGKCPGAVLLVGRGDAIVHQKAFGSRAVRPTTEPMTLDTVFDLASLTKPVATATSVMILVERGKVRLDERVSAYLPDFAQNGKADVTVEQLLLHRSGLIPDNDLADYAEDPAETMRNILAMKPRWPPGTHFAYSDMGYIVLGELVRAVDGRSLDRFAREEIFEPLGMHETGYLPSAALQARCAPTEQRDSHWMRGEVHDPRAFALGGVAGHAGVFSTAADVSRFCRMILRGGELDGHRILKTETVREMTRPRPLPDGTGSRSYVFDVDTPYSGARGHRFAVGTTFGHTGFTGTMLWIDPAHDCYLILLANSVHPEGKGSMLKLRRQVATSVADVLLGPAPSSTSKPSTQLAQGAAVLCGIDVLKAENFAMLQGRRIALVTNHTGVDHEGNRTIDLLAGATNCRLVRIFSPEHGLFGKVDAKVADTVEPTTGLKVFSLYGKTQRPTDEMLDGVDTIVFDIQDAGARYYTYISTMGLCMESATAHKVKMVVLDRPNPVTGESVDGPLADESNLDFIAYAPIPIAHGMTIGELAQLFNAERNIRCDLTVVPMKNWRRPMWWDDTGLKWINPSPNLRNPTEALLYLAVGQLEATNLSVGRGTEAPFELFGAPWIDGAKLAHSLNGAQLAGLRFTPITFTPTSSVFAGKACQGVSITVTDRSVVQPVRAGMTIAWQLSALFGDAFEINGVGRMVRNARTMQVLRETPDPSRIPESWQQPLEGFRKVREKYLLYR